MIQIDIPQQNQHQKCTSFFKLRKNQTTKEFKEKPNNENNKKNSPSTSLTQKEKNNSDNNSKEKKKSNRYYQVRNLSFIIKII